MEFIFLIVGIIIGFIFTRLLEKRKEVYGVITVDHKTELCSFHISSDELANRRNTKAMFIINHDGNISRDEQTL